MIDEAPPPTAAATSAAFDLLERWQHGGGKSRAVEIRHENSYGATPGWEVRLVWYASGWAEATANGIDTRDDPDDGDWPPLHHVVRRAVERAVSAGAIIRGDVP